MVWGRDILTASVSNLKLSGHVIEADNGPFKGSTSPMVDMGMYAFKDFDIGENTPE